MADQETMVAPAASMPDNIPADRIVDIDMFKPMGLEEGFHEAWKRLQQPGTPNLVWTPHNGGHWIATRGTLIREIFSTPEHYSSQVIIIPKEAGEMYDFIPTRMDPPKHTPVRQIVNKLLSLRETRRIEDEVRRMAVALIDPLVASGRCDFSAAYAHIFPIRVFMMMADLPMEDAPLLKHCASQITRPDGTTPAEMAASLDRANKAFFEYLLPVINARRGGAGEDVISVAVNSSIDDRAMTQEEALSLISNLLLAGLDTVVNFLSFLMVYLGRHPEQVRELVENPARIPNSVEELFRRFPVVCDARMVAHDIERDGVQLKRGEMILLPTVLAGLDEQMNEDPWKVDFQRKRPQHATFGEGAHRCAGMHLARTEVTITIQEWLARIPRFRLAEDVAPIYRSGTIGSVEDVVLTWDVSR